MKKIEERIDALQSDLSRPEAMSMWRQLSLSPLLNKSEIESALKKVRKSLDADPFTKNTIVKKLTGKTGSYTREGLEKAIINPESNESRIREISKGLYYSSYPLYRQKRIHSDILSYHNYDTPSVVLDESAIESDLIILDSWREVFQPKRTFRRIASQVHLEGKVAYFYRQKKTVAENPKMSSVLYNDTDGPKRIKNSWLEQLPSEYWKIVGFSNPNYYIIAFNFMYFLQQGTQTELLDPWFRKKLEELTGVVKEKEDKKGYEITNNKTMRDVSNMGVSIEVVKGAWNFWVILPEDKVFVFSDQETTPLAAPSDLGLLLQAKDLEGYAILQQQIASIPLNSMILGEIPYHEGNNSGNHIDDFRISQDAMIYYNELFQQTSPNGVGIAAFPYKNLKMVQFEGVVNGSDIFSKATNQFVNSSITGGLFVTTDKPNLAQIGASKIVETSYADLIYEQFKTFANIVYVNHLGLTNRWTFNIFGDKFSDADTETALRTALTLGQSYLLPKFMAMNDYSVSQANNNMNMINKMKIYDKFKPLQSSYTNSAQGSVGRPSVQEEGKTEEREDVDGQ